MKHDDDHSNNLREVHDCILASLARMERKLDVILRMEVRELMDIDKIIADLQELPSIGDGLDALFAQLQTLIAQGKTDPAKLQMADDLINQHKERVKAAIVANTPAAP